MGAALAGADSLATDSLTAFGPRTPRLLWLNSPANPSGRVLPLEHLRKVVDWCRERGTILVSDECYIECAWEGDKPLSLLDPQVNGGSLSGILAVHSLSKRSNLAGYRCAFVAGDPALVGELLARPQEPRPPDARSAAAGDDRRAGRRRARHRAARPVRRPAGAAEGGTGVRRLPGRPLRGVALPLGAASTDAGAEDCWSTVAWLAERGILVAPGEFYGAAGREHVRVAFTATDERVAAAVVRLTA